MPVPMMDIREMRVRMRDGQVDVRMCVRLVAFVRKVVAMLMMLVVAVPMRVLQPLVRMLVHVPLPHVQPYPQCHLPGGDPEGHRRHFRPDQQR